MARNVGLKGGSQVPYTTAMSQPLRVKGSGSAGKTATQSGATTMPGGVEKEPLAPKVAPSLERR